MERPEKQPREVKPDPNEKENKIQANNDKENGFYK